MKPQKEKPIAEFKIRDATNLCPEMLEQISEWLDGIKHTILEESGNLSKIYTARFWRS